MDKVCIIIPAFNEAETIGAVIDEAPLLELNQRGFDVQVVVVDNNSSDDTAKIAREKGASVIIETHQGKGWAMRTAFEQVEADYVFMVDADYTYPLTFVPQLLTLLVNSHAVVIGSRLTGIREKGAMSRLNLIGNQLLTLMANLLYPIHTTDLCSGLWGFRGEIVKSLNLTASGFNLEANLFANVARNRTTIGQVPIYYRRRPNKQKLVLMKDGIKIGLKLLQERFTRH